MNIRGQFLRFSGVGVIGFVVDSSALYISLYLLKLDLYEGRVLSYFFAATVTWYLNRIFTFTSANAAAPTKQWGRFLLTNGIGGFVNYGAYVLVIMLTPSTTLTPLFSVAVGSLAGLGFNFTASRLFVFNDASTN